MRTEVYRREDGLWAWRIRATNGQIIATDGGQGYSRKKDARVMAERFTYSLPIEPTKDMSKTEPLRLLAEPEGTLHDAADRVAHWLQYLPERNAAAAMSLEADDLRRLVNAVRSQPTEPGVTS